MSSADFRRLLELLSWDSPIHSDGEAARDAGYADVVSQRALTRAWSLPPYWSPGQPEDSLAGTVLAPLVTVPGEGTAMVGTGNTFEYLSDIYPGDRISTTSVLRSVTRKRTRLGDGAFLVLESNYYNQHDAQVARETATGFRYEPSGDRGERDAAAASVPTGSRAGAATQLPAHQLVLTPQRLLMATAVTRDFTPIHWDAGTARATGAPAAFANVTLCEALVERAVRGWIGQRARITSMSTKIVGFACAGDELSMTGRESVPVDEAQRARQIDVVVAGPSGPAVIAQVGVSTSALAP